MSKENLFFMRDPWVYRADALKTAREDARLGFDTRCLHAGFHPLQDLENFRSFVPPIIPSMTYPYETFDKIPCPVYGRTRTPTNSLLEERLAALEGGEACITAGSDLRKAHEPRPTSPSATNGWEWVQERAQLGAQRRAPE